MSSYYRICFGIILLILLGLAFPLYSQDILEIWNYDSILDPRWLNVETLWTADTSVLDPLGLDYVNLSVGEISFSSFGGDSGELRIQAFFAYPTGETNLPGFVIGHGLLMDSFLEWTEIFSAAFRCYALGISAPGHGGSEGLPGYNYPALVGAYPNPRNNHLYQFAYAVMRGITYLEMLPVVDMDWVGGIGFSSGADAILIANGVDDRITFTVPIIPQTDFECGAADSGWIIDILYESGFSPDDSNLYYLQRFISPVNYAEYFYGFNIFICASQDEFEPLNCLYQTYNSLNPEQNRLEIVGNMDHHCYFTPYGLTTPYDCFDNSLTFYTKIIGTTNTILEMLKTGIPVPPIPTVTAGIVGDSVEFEAEVPPFFWATDDVRLWYSTDSAWTFQNRPMNFHLGIRSFYRIRFNHTPQYSLDNIIYFVEARVGVLWLSSVPYTPEDLLPNIRPFPRDFFEVSIPEEHKVPRTLTMNVYPNPFNNTISIVVSPMGTYLDQAAHKSASIEIFDINGKTIFLDTIEHNQYINGNLVWEYAWTPENWLGSGLYFVRVGNGNESINKRVVYLK